MFLTTALLLAPATAGAFALWYNGDFDSNTDLYGLNWLTPTEYANVFEDFDVGGGGWNVQSVFSNNVSAVNGFPSITQAYWEIRQGVGAGVPGTLVASGLSAATATSTGRQLYAIYDEYTIRVSGLSVNLAPGKYWLSVAPDDQNYEYYYVTGTSGTNAVGSPAGNNGNAFLRSDYFGANYDPAEYYGNGGYTYDHSMGIDGTLSNVPEPATLTLIGFLVAGGASLRRRSRPSR
jgi:hypothetical protein